MNYSDWPKLGDTRAQPWETEDTGISPRAGLPLLVSGGATGPGAEAHALFTSLATLGYDTPISRGENPYGTIGPGEIAAVRSFRRDYGVREDPEAFGGDNPQGNMVADSHIGPWTGEAILRAAAAKGAPAETPDRELELLRERVAELEARQGEAGEVMGKVSKRVDKLEAKPKTAKPKPKAPAAA